MRVAVPCAGRKAGRWTPTAVPAKIFGVTIPEPVPAPQAAPARARVELLGGSSLQRQQLEDAAALLVSAREQLHPRAGLLLSRRGRCIATTLVKRYAGW
jgi:hypothetical protein